MKKIYESFEDLANAMVDGEGLLHSYNCINDDEAYEDPCCAWQHGVTSFAEWLDHIGVKVNITDGAKNFYDFMAKKYHKKIKRRKK